MCRIRGRQHGDRVNSRSTQERLPEWSLLFPLHYGLSKHPAKPSRRFVAAEHAAHTGPS